MEALPSPLSSRAQPRDLQFYGPFLGMFFDRAYPDFLPLRPRENRMKFTEATKFHRKSGEGLGNGPEDDPSAVVRH